MHRLFRFKKREPLEAIQWLLGVKLTLPGLFVADSVRVTPDRQRTFPRKHDSFRLRQDMESILDLPNGVSGA
jgi:hypothetical protein